MPRPKLPANARRDVIRPNRYTPAEAALLDSASTAAGISPTELVRTAALESAVAILAAHTTTRP